MTEFNANTSYNNIITYYKSELEIKKREINNLKKEIVQLTKDNSSQTKRIEQLKYQNFKVKELYESKIALETKKQSMSQTHLCNQISKLSDEVNELRQSKKSIMACGSSISNDEAFDYKRIKIAYNELEVINHANTEIIERMQVFYNRMNKLFNKNNDIVLDYINDSMDTFKYGLFTIENGLYEQYGIIQKRDIVKEKGNKQYHSIHI